MARCLTVIAPLGLGVATLGMILKVEPWFTWYYALAWWCYIAFGEAFLCLRGGESELFSNPRKFLVLLPLSITIWLVFEAFNFRLMNWHYIDLPANRAVRWFGYSISFSTVLPGIYVTTRILEFIGFLKGAWRVRMGHLTQTYNSLLAVGAVFFLLPLFWPQYFFPLVWGAFVLLLDPLNHRFGGLCVLGECERGSIKHLMYLLLAGALCGLLWEFWNFWAGSKWVYTIPYVGSPKIFEMPILGFLGFPPFALECYVMTGTFFMLTDRIRGVEAFHLRCLAWGGLAAVMVLFDLLVFMGIDAFTVISFKSQ